MLNAENNNITEITTDKKGQLIVMDPTMLSDNWHVKGNNRTEMMEALKKLTSITKIVPCSTDQIQIMTVRSIDSEGISGFLHSKGGSKNVLFKQEVLKAQGLTDIVLDETSKNFLLFKIGGGLFFSSKSVLRTLCQRAGTCMGDFAAREEMRVRFHRDAGYVAYMEAVPAPCQVLFRQVGDTKKILSVFTDRYKLIPQHTLVTRLIADFEQELGRADIKYYDISNYTTEILMEFPEKADDFTAVYNLKETVIPGIRILLSDSGDSSFIINGTMRIGKSVTYVPGAEYSRAHTKNADLSSISDTTSERVFKEYTKFPERLCELLQIDIKTPSLLIPQVIASCGFKKEFGAKFEKNIIQDLQDGINPSISYTAYDIATMILDYAADNEEKRSMEAISRLRNCSAKAVFYKYGA